MSRRNENWLLVEWVGGGTDVVYLKSVLSPVKELKIGDALTVNWRGEPKAAKLIGRAKERNQLDSMKTEETGESSPRPNDDDNDYSASGSSWAPSDDGASEDSDRETSKKIKLEKFHRQYMNRRSGKKILTPSHRANAVIPAKMVSDNSKKNSSDRKRTYNKISQNSFNKSLPDSTKINNTVNNGTEKQIVVIDVRELEDIGNSFNVLFKMLEDLKRRHIQNGFVEDVKTESQLNGIENDTVIHADSECDANEYDHDEDFDRSDDNVLITNKYESQFTDASSASPQEKVKTNQNNATNQDEWIPIGSGKTMIHKDQFQKVNWKSYTIATRTLLLAIFPRRVLATHSLTGKRSPAFQNKPAKMCLDPKIISDVILEITDRFNVKENLVRSIITTKCADECKMWKQRKGKKSLPNNNQENVPPNKIDYVAS